MLKLSLREQQEQTLSSLNRNSILVNKHLIINKHSISKTNKQTNYLTQMANSFALVPNRQKFSKHKFIYQLS